MRPGYLRASPPGHRIQDFLPFLPAFLRLRKFSFYLECVVYGNPRAVRDGVYEAETGQRR